MSGYAECRNDEAARARGERRGARGDRARAARSRRAARAAVDQRRVRRRTPFRAAADAPDGATAYGRSKALAEAGLRAIDPAAAILRLTRVFVPGEPLLAGWAERLRAGRAGRGVRRHGRRAGPRRSRRRGAARDRARAARGIRQLSARREVTYVEIARHIATRVGASPELVSPVAAATRGIGPGEAPRHASLACERPRGLRPRADRSASTWWTRYWVNCRRSTRTTRSAPAGRRGCA
jgi:hypothetical protein